MPYVGRDGKMALSARVGEPRYHAVKGTVGEVFEAILAGHGC